VTNTYVDGSTVGSKWKTLGVYRFSSTEWYLLCVKPTGASTADLIAVLNGDFANVPIVIKSLTTTSLNIINGFAQIDDIAYFLVDPAATISGFKWVKGGATTDIPTMKKGKVMVSYKSRLWIAGANSSNLSSRMYFSAIDTVGYKPDVWNTDDYFDVAAGEGGFITALLPLNSNIIVFKNDGTWRFSYPSAPKNGQVEKVSGSIGAANDRCVLEFENYVYVYDQGRFYELVNSTYTHMNRFVKFALDPSAVDGVAPEAEISLVNRRILVRYFNNVYVYSIDTRSWSQWRSFVGVPGRFIELPADSNSTESSVYIAPSQGTIQNLGTSKISPFNETYRSYMATLIGTGTVAFGGTTITVTTTSGTTTCWLNNSDGISNYNLKLRSGEKWRLTGNVARTGAAPVARMTYLLNDGTTSFVDITLDLVAVDKTFTAPQKAIAANLHIRQTGAGTYSLLAMELKRHNVAAPYSLIRLKDEYRSTPLPVEYIDCLVRTKSYDYKAPASHKRLFWWAADLKTTRQVTARMIPVAVKKRPTWGELQAYTHAQLSAGTWGNPLGFLEVVLDIEDGADPSNDLTENGRVLMKFKKSIRFKQVSFELQLSSLGNEATGPAKLHALITFVLPKEKVTERTN
jgi:hypothetical protein